jgi:hypothetical protein
MSFFDIKQPSWTNSPASFLGEPFFFQTGVPVSGAGTHG